ncbi:MAG TPA: threonine ammonia-lyase [Tepidisphaeraceae bacterium]|jgi:threonine dehydratase
MSVTLADIQAARERIAGRVYRSPCPQSNYLSELLGAKTHVKLENLQATGSFKERGACNRLLRLSPQEQRRGVICASAGNHAQALAYHGRALRVPVTVVMPKWAPLVKVSNCRRYGATVILHGEHFHDARAHALDLAAANDQVFVPPFDDPDVIAGAGTIGLEILEEVPDVDAVFVPAGGGGLIAGMVAAIKPQRPQTLIYGAESASATTLHSSLAAGRVQLVPTRPTLADGLAVAEMGQLCFDIVRDHIEKVVLVDEPQIASSILRLLEVEKTLVEGAGAIALAAALAVKEELAGKTIVLILCGGNIDVTVLSRIIDRGLRVDGRLCRIVARIGDRPGNLAQLLAVIAGAGGSIKDVAHDRHFGPADVARVTVSCIVETQGFDHIARVRSALAEAGIDVALDD